MYISEVNLKNFRLFSDIKVVLNKGMNLFIGENNSGKTAFIDAIRYTLDTTIERLWVACFRNRLILFAFLFLSYRLCLAPVF